MTYKIRIEQRALKLLKKLDPADKNRIKNAISQLAHDPSQGKPLKARFKGLWRYRVGHYRLIYSRNDDQLVILILRNGHRKDIYR